MSVLQDGFSTTIALGEAPSGGVTFYEIGVTTPPLEGGGAVEQTTMRNTAYRTRAPKTLKDLGPMTLTVAYDPVTYDDVQDMLNVVQQITVTEPDASTFVFWGWIDAFTPGENAEGERPTAELTIIPGNLNGSDVETAPVYSA